MEHTATRQFLLARPEARVLEWIAKRMPSRVKPDHLTALGVLASLGIAAAYVLSNGDRMWLWAASGAAGRPLAGRLARRHARAGPAAPSGRATATTSTTWSTPSPPPRSASGSGLSPYMLLAVGLAIVVAYLILSINTYLETHAFGVFTLGYGRFGPTEARVMLIAVNTAAGARPRSGTASSTCSASASPPR